MAANVGQLSTDELKEIIGSLVEQKLKEILGDPDEGLEIRADVRSKGLRSESHRRCLNEVGSVLIVGC